MNFLGLLKIAAPAAPHSPASLRSPPSPPLTPPQTPPSPGHPSRRPTTPAITIVDHSTTPETKPTSRWWHDSRFNARSHLAKRRLGSDPSSSVRVETGTAGNI